jgi:putative peptidoglycan lipid II flippase
VLLGGALWATAWFGAPYLAQLPTLRDEAALLLLIVVGAIVYGAAVLLLFGPRWLKRLVRG